MRGTNSDESNTIILFPQLGKYNTILFTGGRKYQQWFSAKFYQLLGFAWVDKILILFASPSIRYKLPGGNVHFNLCTCRNSSSTCCSWGKSVAVLLVVHLDSLSVVRLRADQLSFVKLQLVKLICISER